MFLKQLPLKGDWKVLAALLIALTATGCANLNTPDSTDRTRVAVAIPLQTQDSAGEIDSPQAQNFDDFSEAAARNSSASITGGNTDEFPASMPLVETPMDLDIEIQAEQSELALKKQQRAEAEVIASIEASAGNGEIAVALLARA